MPAASQPLPPFVDLRPFVDGVGRTVDPVDPGAACLLDADDAAEAGLLPFAASSTAVYVAVDWPLRPDARRVLAALGRPVRIARAEPADLRRAQERVYGPGRRRVRPDATPRPAPGPLRPRPRFGRLAVALGRLDAGELETALQVQARQGGQLGAILTSDNHLNYREAARVVAHQAQLPLVELLEAVEGDDREEPISEDAERVRHIDPSLFDLMPEPFWRAHAAVPVERRSGQLFVAVENPADTELLTSLSAATSDRIALLVTGRRDVLAALEARYRTAYLQASREDLIRRRPEDSASSLLSRPQQIVLGALAAAMVLGLWRFAAPTLMALNGCIEIAYLALIVFRMWLLRQPTDQQLEVQVSDEQLAALDPSGLPVYTVLVPARHEAAVLPTLAQALREIDYPKDRLDVKLLLEADDEETLGAARACGLPNFIEIVTVPPAEPRTKPKACNYGLYHARGEYVVIFDAEDIPEPTQLKKALVAFRQAGPQVACVQAKLSYYNRAQNLLTRWFTVEYAMWFELLLPGLQNARLPIPLGGTSNHLRAAVLRELGAWDPFNVAEDADLGVRLHKAGYRTAVVDSTTYEEANPDFVNWVRQRSRWTKGYVQTWLVHMRHPARLWRELGARGFWGFQAMLLGTPLVYVLNPLYWMLTTAWFLTSWGLVPQIFPSPVYFVGMTSLLFGNFAFTFLNMVAAARRGDWDLVKHAALSPMYWGMMSLAAWKALVQLVTRPSHWEKTVHGLADVSMLSAGENASGGTRDLHPRGVAV